MKIIIVCFVLIAICDGALLFIPAPGDKDYEGCRDSSYPELKQMAPKEEVQLDGKCILASCDETGTIILASCSPIHVEPPLKLSVIDYTKPYPECCPKPVSS